MALPLSYTWRSLWTRRLTTVLTVGGVALVVFVFAAVLMLAHGLEKTLVETGSDENVIVLRRSANSELVSQLGREGVNVIKTQAEVATLSDGRPLASSEVFVIINLHKKETGDMGNVSVRGVSPQAFDLRPQAKIFNGRPFQFGTHEIVIGKNIATQFSGCGIGKELEFGGDKWTIVGHFEAGRTGFESEIWGDVEQLMPAFGRPIFSSLTLRLKDRNDFDAFKKRVEEDPRTQYAEVKREQTYYREQSQLMADFIRILGMIVTIIFSVGAVIGAMITMYAAVANRSVEIGTLRALGFRRRSVLGAFLIESITISLAGGAAGVGLASLMSFITISTVNFGTFSELAFGFSLSLSVVTSSLFFSVLMGIGGGFLPAVRAARSNIVNSLRAE